MTTKEDLEKLEAVLAEILKDIEEIDEIISEYDEKGTLNRDKLFQKFKKFVFQIKLYGKFQPMFSDITVFLFVMFSMRLL